MRKIVAVLCAALVVLVAGAALAQARVSYVETRDDYRVIVDGITVAVVDSEEEAQSLAEAELADDPDARVRYVHRQVYRADVVASPTTTTVAATTTTTAISTTTTTAAPPPTAPPPTSPTTTTTAVTTTTTVVPSGDLVWGYDDTPPSQNWTKPAPFVSYQDPAYGSTVRRVTSADGTRFDRNTYSRRQAENADGTMFLTYHGDAVYHVYNRQSGALVRRLDIAPGADPQWHPTDSDVIRHVLGGNSYVGDLRLHQVNVTTGASTVIADLTDRLQAALPGALYMHDRAEGSPSVDGSANAWLVYNRQEDIIGIVSYDLATDTIIGILPAADLADAGPLDWVSASPSGDYVVASHWNGTFVYNADLTNRRLILNGAEHSDIAINGDGNDAYVYIDFTAGADGGWLMSVDLTTMARTRIFNLYNQANTSIHISGKGYDKPGWVVASTYSCKVDGAWSCGKVMAVELAQNGRVLNLAHTYNCGENYWTETHAVVNRDFTRVYFNSDSGSCGIDAEVYLIYVPPFS